MKRFARWTVGCLAAGVVALAAVAVGVEHFARSEGPAVGQVVVNVPLGAHARGISRLLAQHGVIRSEWMFTLYVRFGADRARKLQAGHYRLQTPLSPRALVAMLQEGRPKQIRVTILEGGTKQDIARWLAQAGLADESAVLAAMESEELRREFGVPQRGAGDQATIPGGIEGYLYPDTYLFDAHGAPADLLRAMHRRLLQTVDAPMRTRMEKLGWSLHQVLTLASLVQQETSAAHERTLVAGVFHNRLRQRPPMRLQCDPTVRYGLATFQGFYPPTKPDRLRTKDLRNPHPYNTYVHGRLPPGPISSPGIEAIRAALWPARTEHLYFVSRNDGTHVFCPTYACHKRAVRQWQLNSARGNKSR